jgi:hypothetical protein
MSNDPIGQNFIAADARRTPKFDHERVINATIISIFNGGAAGQPGPLNSGLAGEVCHANTTTPVFHDYALRP